MRLQPDAPKTAPPKAAKFIIAATADAVPSLMPPVGDPAAALPTPAGEGLYGGTAGDATFGRGRASRDGRPVGAGGEEDGGGPGSRPRRRLPVGVHPGAGPRLVEAGAGLGGGGAVAARA